MLEEICIRDAQEAKDMTSDTDKEGRVSVDATGRIHMMILTRLKKEILGIVSEAFDCLLSIESESGGKLMYISGVFFLSGLLLLVTVGVQNMHFVVSLLLQ